MLRTNHSFVFIHSSPFLPDNGESQRNESQPSTYRTYREYRGTAATGSFRVDDRDRADAWTPVIRKVRNHRICLGVARNRRDALLLQRLFDVGSGVIS